MREAAHGVMVYNTREILDILEDRIENSEPFSLIRYGDGGLKLIHSYVYKDDEQLKIIIKKEGLRRDIIKKVLQLWGYYGKRADFIDTPEVYFMPWFWDRLRAREKEMKIYTINRMHMWRILYNKIHIPNKKLFCNPEFNFLAATRFDTNQRTLIDIIADEDVCLITDTPKVTKKLPGNVDTYEIVSQYANHYMFSYRGTLDFIRENASSYKLILVAAGELGRIYSGRIKELGGRALDIGFLVQYWDTGEIPIRLSYFIQQGDNPIEFKLTDKGKHFERYL